MGYYNLKKIYKFYHSGIYGDFLLTNSRLISSDYHQFYVVNMNSLTTDSIFKNLSKKNSISNHSLDLINK